MNDKKTPAEMMGDFLREASVLVLVFAPLDMVFAHAPFTGLNVVAILAGCGFLLTLGILVEVVRQ